MCEKEIKSIQVIRYFEEDDKDMDGDPYEVSLIINGEIVQSGDDYHDRIEDKILGFIQGLRWSLDCDLPKVEYLKEVIS